MLTNARLAVSNIAWTPELDEDAFARLVALGVAGVEIAPGRIAGWDALTPERVTAFRNRIDGLGLQISSLQAVLFGIEGAHLLGSESDFAVFRVHMERVAEIGGRLGAEVAVFGAPKNRLLHGRAPEAAAALAAERLGLLAPAFQAAGMMLGIEPVPFHYGGEFLTHADDVAALVHRIDHPAIRLHLDTGCVFLGGDRIADKVVRHAGILAHFHAAEPDLAGFAEPRAAHADAAAALREIGYRRWVSVEMKPQGPDPLAALEQAVRHVSAVYFGSASPE